MILYILTSILTNKSLYALSAIVVSLINYLTVTLFSQFSPFLGRLDCTTI